MLKLYNTLTKQKEHFHPMKDNTVRMYTCGPTVYHSVHIGNLRTYVFEDVLKRTLKMTGYKVRHVMNITDVGHLTDDGDNGEDKMEKGARREGKSAWDIAKMYTESFKQDIVSLNILEPDIWCRATDHIPEQIALVQILIDKGYTYTISGGIYFDTTKFPDYGKLGGLEKQKLKAGARVDLGEKKNIHDFALWKFSDPEEKRQMEWEAFGKRGFPGWHIECSAMAMKYLGDQFDIHCGGIDLIPIHHTNEIVQAEAATGKQPWVTCWLHGEFLMIADESTEVRMAKSGENFITLPSLVERGFSPLAYRYFLLQAHYRKQLAFSYEALDAAEQGLKRLRLLVRNISPRIAEDPHLMHEFEEAIYDDLNTAEALAVLWDALKQDRISLPMVIQCDKILGLNLHLHEEEKVDIPEEVQLLLTMRAQARLDGDWKESDRLRGQMKESGFLVEDTKEGQKVQRIRK